MKITIDNEEVLSNKDFTINEEMLNTSSVILNNVYPVEWEQDKDYVSRFYYPEDYSKCKIFNEINHPEEKSTANGTGFTLNNVDLDKQYYIEDLKGQTTQTGTPTPSSPIPVETTTGRQEVVVCEKNLFDKNTTNILNANLSNSKINSSANERVFFMKCKPNTTYTFSISLPNSYKRNTIATTSSYPNFNMTIDNAVYSATAPKTYTTGANAEYIVWLFYSTSNPDYTEQQTKDSMMIELGSTTTTYEEYKGNTYEINLGKNLFNANNVVLGKVWNVYNNTKRAYGYIEAVQGQTYTVSTQNTDTDLTVYVVETTTVGQAGTNIRQVTVTSSTPQTFIPRTNTKYIVIQFANTTNNTTQEMVDNANVQIELGNLSSYAPYKTPIELCKIGTYQDYIRKNTGINLCKTGSAFSGNNQQWYNQFGENLGTVEAIQSNSNYIDLEPNTTYKFFLQSYNNISNMQVIYLDNTNTLKTYANYSVSTNVATFTTTSYTRIYLRAKASSTASNTYFIGQLTKGETVYPYEPYGEGQWYIHKEIGRYDFLGTENFTASQWGTNSWDLFNIIETTWNTNELQIMSNLFKGIPHVNRGTGGNNIIYTISNNGFEIRNTSYSTLTDIRNATKGNYIYWVLKTPTTTLIEDEELVNQLESIKLISGLNNVSISSPNLPFIMDLVYNYVPAYTEEDILFCGIVKNTGNISLNPRYPHYCNLQVLDFKDFLSQGETLDFVINNKTIEEAIEQVISVIAPYGFIKGEVKLNAKNMVMGAYSTKDKTAYDVFNYLADITQSRWTTRMIDENTIAVDFYDTDKLPVGTPIDYNQTWFANHKIDDMSFSYSSNDYRNKQVMLSGEVYSNIETTEVITADGYQTQFNTIDKIGYVSSIAINGTPATIITKDEQELGYVGDFIYQPGNAYFESDDLISTGAVITIVYYAIIEGREIILNQSEIQRVANMTGRKGIVARYENRNDATTTDELQRIGKSYLKYKGIPEIKLNVSSRENTWNIGDRVIFNSPLAELSQEYMVKSKKIQHITTIDELFYEYELTSSFNMEQEVNFFDNQRYKTNGNIGEGEYISRNIDIENTANIIFYDLEVNEVQISGDSTLQSTLQTPLGVE